MEIQTNGTKFEGEFKYGKRHGRGKLRNKNGSLYEGDFFNGLIHGEGTYTWKNNRKY